MSASAAAAEVDPDDTPPLVRTPTRAEEAELAAIEKRADAAYRRGDRKGFDTEKRRKFALLDATYGPLHPILITELADFAGFLELGEDYAASLPLRQRVVAIEERASGPASTDFADALSELSGAEAMLGRYADAEAHLKRAIGIYRAAPDADAEDRFDVETSLAYLYARQGRHDLAVPVLEALIRQGDQLRQPDDDRKYELALLATSLDAVGRSADALRYARRGVEGARAGRRKQLETDRYDPFIATVWIHANKVMGRQLIGAEPYDALIAVVAHRAQAAPGEKAALGREAFRAAQDARESLSGRAVLEAMAEARGTPEQARLVQLRHDLLVQYGSEFEQLMSMAQSGEFDDDNLINRRNATGVKVVQATVQLRRAYPGFFDLVDPAATEVAAVQARLAADRALVLIRDNGDDLDVFVVTKTAFDWRHVPGAAKRSRTRTAQILCQIDVSNCPTDRPRPADGAFDFKAAYGLYEDTLKPFEAQLAGVRRLLVSATGSVSTLPAAVMLTSDQAKPTFAGAPWLADRYAITTVPSVAAFVGFADTPATPAGAIPFVGYGQPTLGGDTAEVRAAAVRADWFVPARTGFGRLANVSKLRTLTPLPATGPELRRTAATLGSAPGAVHLAERDDEGQLKADPQLAGARVISFATHGILLNTAAASLYGQRFATFEPGLVFTPPATASSANDGLLTATEAASLRLSADWVILSACNTATSESAADSLSSLSTAFLGAGAKALLASRWRVSDAATSELIVKVLASYAQGGSQTPKSVALQKAMHELRTTSPQYAHPRYWAPFILVAATDS